MDQKLWYTFIKSSFMMKLSGNRKESAQIGHEMEKVYTRTLVENSFKKAIQSIDLFIKFFIVSGLLQQKEHLYMRTSIDGLLYATLNGEKEIIGVEFKARTSSATTQAEQIRLDDSQQND
eukprot:11194751-Ditylum_brightwellii.AAC.1